MRYLLDTDICIYIARKRPAAVSDRLALLKHGDVGMSAVTYLELIYGAWKSHYFEKSIAQVEAFERLVPAQPLTGEVARHYGTLRRNLERSGSRIGAYDMLIAAHALSLDLILVTNKVREFGRVQGLRLENWVQ